MKGVDENFDLIPATGPRVFAVGDLLRELYLFGGEPLLFVLVSPMCVLLIVSENYLAS
jgi:hypothetical protein